MSKNLPRVSVVINNHNYESFLPDAVGSALGQSYRDVEVVVVDDGSTDGSRDVLRSYGSTIRAVLQPNRGQAAALNKGFAACTGDIVMFLDADDFLLPNAAEQVAELFRSPKVAKVHWPLWEVSADGRRTGKLRPEALLPEGDLQTRTVQFGPLGQTSPPTSGNAFARGVLERILPMPTAGFEICADAYVVLLASVAGTTKRSLSPLACWRRHGSNNYNGTKATVQERVDDDLRRYALLASGLREFLAHDRVDVDPELWKKRNFAYKRLERLRWSIGELAKIVPPGRTLLLVDDLDWNQGQLEGRDVLRDRRIVRLFETTQSAKRQPTGEALLRKVRAAVRSEGTATHLAFAWPGGWWLEHYDGLTTYLGGTHRCVMQRHSLVVYELQRPTRGIRRPGVRDGAAVKAVEASHGRRRRTAITLEQRLPEIEHTLRSLGEKSDWLRKELVRQESIRLIRALVETKLPPTTRVLVVSRGDSDLMTLGEREAWHFPQTADGTYAGHHPTDSDEAIRHLEDLRSRGGRFLLIPCTSFWWLDHYSRFADHLERCYALVAQDPLACAIFDLRLRGRRANGANGRQPPKSKASRRAKAR